MVHTGGAYLSLNQKLTFLYYSFGIYGLKNFIIQDDESVIQKMLFGIEKITRTDSKITLKNITFLMNACKNLNKAEIVNLSDTAGEFSYFFQSFGSKLSRSVIL